MKTLLTPLRLAVLSSVLSGLVLAGVALARGPFHLASGIGNVNSITHSGNGRCNSLIVEMGADGRVAQSTFIHDDPTLNPNPQPPTDPMPAVPAVPERVPEQPQPVDPQVQPQPQPVAPQPQPMDPMQPQPVDPHHVDPRPMVLPPEIVIRIPVPQPPVLRGPVVQIPGIRTPHLEIPPMQVPAGRAYINEGPNGRTTIINYGNSRSTSIISSGGTTTVVGDGLCYRGDSRFWTRSMYSRECGCTVYYDPRTTLWFRYNERDNSFRPVPLLDDDD